MRARPVRPRPDRITLEFGVKVTAEAGVVFSRTAVEAHFTVGAEWESTGERLVCTCAVVVREEDHDTLPLRQARGTPPCPSH